MNPRDVDLSFVFPLERLIRRWPRAAGVVAVSIALSPALLAVALAWLNT